MKTLLFIVNIPIELINVLVLFLIFTHITKIKKDKKKTIKYLCLLGISYVFERLIIPDPYYKILFTITGVVLLIKVLEVPVKTSILFQTISFIIMLTIEPIFSKSFCTIFEIPSYFEGIKILVYKISMNLSFTVILLMVYQIIKRIDISKHVIITMDKKDVVRSICFFMVGIILLYSRLFEVGNNPILIGILDFVGLILLFYIIASDIIKNFKIKNANIQINNLEQQNKNLTNINDSVRGFKHDFDNIVQAIIGYIEVKDLSALKRYFDRLLKECNDIKTLEKLNPELINNPAIYGILINKYQMAEKYNITMNIDTLFDFKFIEENIYDISRMFGILLDNAIEATKYCEEKVVNIQFYKQKKNKYVISIENTYVDDGIDTDKMFEKDYTTKEGNSGFGLWEVRKIVRNHRKLDLYTTKDNKMFRQQIEIYQ